MSGFVYVVRNSAGLLKIGYTNDPQRRLTMLRTSAADDLKMLGVVPGTAEDERQLHALFAEARVAREWFRYIPAMQPLLDGLRPYRNAAPREVAHDNWRAPASNIIEACGGIDEVSKITNTHPSRVYQWMYPKERGGTDGRIPHGKAKALLRHARNNNIPITADDFFRGLI